MFWVLKKIWKRSMHSENTTYGFSLGTPAFECILNRRTLLSGHGAEMKIEPPWAIWNLFCPWTLGEAYWLETALSLVCLKQNIQASGLINRCEMSQLAVKNCFFGFTITIQKWFLPPLPTPPTTPLISSCISNPDLARWRGKFLKNK